MQTYLVGGAVRDKLLKLKSSDFDYVVVGATIDDMLAQGYTPVGKDFPVFLHPQTKDEYALARTEKKIAKGYKGFSFYTSSDISIEDDLLRRDLTINAIAQDSDGELIDPYFGLRDLKDKILRHVSNAFSEDPLRVLRVARFAARFNCLGFSVAKETMQLMQQMVNCGEVDALVSERVWKEIEKSLLEPNPEVFFQVLRDCGALQRLLPEVDNLFGVPQPAKWHPEIDAGVHTLMVLQQSTQLIGQVLTNNKALTEQEKTYLTKENQVAVQFSALVHDLGKALTSKDELPSHKMHEIRGVPLVKALCQRLKIPKQSCDLALLVTEHHLLYHRVSELKKGTVIKLFNTLDAFRRPERFKLFLLACEADSRGRTGFENIVPEQTAVFEKHYKQAKAVNVKDIIEQGYKKQQISEQLYLRRCKSLS